MTENDLQKIEDSLGIALPSVYREKLLAFPVPACAGNSDTELWDDAQKLIDVNKQLHTGEYSYVKPWPAYLFCLGVDQGGCAMAIDLRKPEAPMWWLDRCHVDVSGSGEINVNFAAWTIEWANDQRVDLEEHGIDPEGTPQQRERILDEAGKGGCLWAIGIAVAFAIALVAFAFVFGIGMALVRRLLQ